MRVYELVWGVSISIHALLAESDLVGDVWACRWPDISIHALLAESDQANAVDQILPGHISIHALLAESDSAKSTPEEEKRYFYPRSPCGERQEKR